MTGPNALLPEGEPTFGRDDAIGFAQRTLRNLEFIRAADLDGKDVHLTTQVVLSLLGIVVFPFEAEFHTVGADPTLGELATRGWPLWTIERSSVATDTLRELTRHVRNAVAHNQVSFDSDSHVLTEVRLRFVSRDENHSVIWSASIRADELLRFCQRFCRFVEDILG